MKTLLRITLLFLFLALALAGFMFIRNNAEPVPLWFFNTFPSRPSGQWYLLFFVAGGFTGLAAGYGLLGHFRNMLRIRKLKSQIASLLAENEQLRGKQASVLPVESGK